MTLGEPAAVPASDGAEITPAQCERRILVAGVGLTPQVVTETIYALTVLRSPAFTPTEIHLVTTREGARRIELTLLDPESTILSEFARDHGFALLPELLTTDAIHIVRDPDDGQDPQAAADDAQASAADRITELMRRLTADPDAAVHVSIAGGRKTMSFLLGYALSLFARGQDALSHVLVSPAFQAHPQFFYPPARPRTLLGPGQEPLRTNEANIELADIPFVRLREGLPLQLLQDGLTYSETVAALQERFRAPSLAIDLVAGTAHAHGQLVQLPPLLRAWWIWFARTRLAGEGADTLSWRDADPSGLLNIYARLVGRGSIQFERVEQALREGMTKAYFDEKKAALNGAIRARLGPAAGWYCTEAVGRRPHTRFRLVTPPECIRIHEAGAPPS